MTIRHVEVEQLFCFLQSIPTMPGHAGLIPIIRIGAHARAHRANRGKPGMSRHPALGTSLGL